MTLLWRNLPILFGICNLFVSTRCEFYLLFSRLLGYLELVSGGRGLVTWTGNPLSELENCPEAAQAMELLQQAFEVSDL